MFDEYLEDSHYFAATAIRTQDEREAKRFFRASVFYAASSLESFVFYISDFLNSAGTLQPYEIGLLTDKQFRLLNGRFALIDKFELHGVEDKLRFLLCKYDPTYDFGHSKTWANIMAFKDFRNSIVHPAYEIDETSIEEYKRIVKNGLGSIIELISHLCQNIIGKPLRKGIFDLTL